MILKIAHQTPIDGDVHEADYSQSVGVDMNTINFIIQNSTEKIPDKVQKQENYHIIQTNYSFLD